LVENEKIQVLIEKKFSLLDIKEAHKLSESHHVQGKIIVRVINEC
jgi:NADPH:quinone reductase-like Zn-dependent oxidoreductase